MNDDRISNSHDGPQRGAQTGGHEPATGATRATRVQRGDHSVGRRDYGSAHARSADVADAEVIDLALVRDRLAGLLGERQTLTRQIDRSAGKGARTHTGSPTLSPNTSTKPSTNTTNPTPTSTPGKPSTVHRATTHPLVAAVLPDGLADICAPVGDGASLTGTLAHRAIAVLAPHADRLNHDTLIETVLLLARAICPPGRMHRKTSTLVAGYAAEYLLSPICPRAPWKFVGAEVAAGNGQVDLAWQHAVTDAVFFDEIKTTTATRVVADEEWLTQCSRYAAAGPARYGDAFVGVRLLPLGSMNVAALIRPGLPTTPLRPTLADPLASPFGLPIRPAPTDAAPNEQNASAPKGGETA